MDEALGACAKACCAGCPHSTMDDADIDALAPSGVLEDLAKVAAAA